MQNHYLKSGFSLIELLVYIAIFSIVSGFIWQGIRWIEEKNDHLAKKQATIRQGLQVFDSVSKMVSDLSPVEVYLSDTSNDCLNIGVNSSLKFKSGTDPNFYALFKYANLDCNESSGLNKISDYIFKLNGVNPPLTFFTLAPNQNETKVILNVKLADKTSEYSMMLFEFRSKLIFLP